MLIEAKKLSEAKQNPTEEQAFWGPIVPEILVRNKFIGELEIISDDIESRVKNLTELNFFSSL